MIAAIIAVCVIVLIAVVSMTMGSGASSRTKQTCEAAHRECAQLILLAEQDANPVVRLMHASSAVAYANILGQISTPENYQQTLGLSLTELREHAKKAQTDALNGFHQIPKSPVSMSAGWNK